MDEIKVLIPEDDIRKRIKEIAEELSEKYKGDEVIIIGILSGAVFFFTELVQKMTIPVTIDFMCASSYTNGTETSGEVKITKDITQNIEGKRVVIVEDIIDTGLTMKKVKEVLLERNPKSVEIVVLLDKPERRRTEMVADKIGFEIPDVFIVGWGLDYDQKYRSLPYLGIINTEK